MLQFTQIENFELLNPDVLVSRNGASVRELQTCDNSPLKVYGQSLGSYDSFYIVYEYQVQSNYWKRVSWGDNCSLYLEVCELDNNNFFAISSNKLYHYTLDAGWQKIGITDMGISCDKLIKINNETMIIVSNSTKTIYKYVLDSTSPASTSNLSSIVFDFEISKGYPYGLQAAELKGKILTMVFDSAVCLKLNVETLEYTKYDIEPLTEINYSVIYKGVCYCIDYAKTVGLCAFSIDKPVISMKIADIVMDDDYIINTCVMWAENDVLYVYTNDKKLFATQTIGNIVVNQETEEIDYKTVDTKTESVFYVTKNGDGYFHGNLEVTNGNTYANIKPSADNIFEIGVGEQDDESTDNENKLLYVTKDGELYVKGNIEATTITLSEDAEVSGNINATSGSIGGFTISSNSISNTNLSLNGANGDILSIGTDKYMYLYNGQLLLGQGTAVDTSKPYSYLDYGGLFLANKSSLTSGVTNYLLEANSAYDCVTINTHTPAQSALYVNNDSYTDVSTLSGHASCATLKTSYSGFSNRPLDIITAVGGTDAEGQAWASNVYVNFFGESAGSGDGSSYDTYGRSTVRASVRSVDEEGNVTWIGNTYNQANGYIPSSLGSASFRWGQGFFCDLNSTSALNVTSDKKVKNHVAYLDGKESLEFINSLKPSEYTMTFSENKRLHRGFYAQDVSKASKELGLGNLSLYSAYVEKDGEVLPYNENEDDENLRWSLKYEEFIAPMVSAIQELSKENEDKDNKITELEQRLAKMEQLVEELLNK